MISVCIKIVFARTSFFFDFIRKSFSENFFNLTVFLIQGDIAFFLIEVTILPFETTSFPPTKTLAGLNDFKSLNMRISASFPGAIPPRSFPIL